MSTRNMFSFTYLDTLGLEDTFSSQFDYYAFELDINYISINNVLYFFLFFFFNFVSIIQTPSSKNPFSLNLFLN